MSPAVISIIIFAICVVFFIWNRIPVSITALLGLTAMVLFDVVSFSEGFKNFGSTTIILICGMMVMGQATFETGLAQIVGEKVVSLARDDERKLIMIATLLTAVVSAFVSNVATLSIMISIITGICATNKNIHFMNIIFPVAMGAVLGGSATLIGSTPQLAAQGLLEEYLGVGNGFTFSTFAVPGIVIIAVLVFYAGFIGYPLGKKLWGNRPEYNMTMAIDENTELPPKDPKKMTIMSIIFVITVALFILCEPISKIIPNFNVAIISILSATACVLTNCIGKEKAISSISWRIVIWFCSCLGIAGALSKSGGGELMARWFIGLFGENISPFILFAAFLILVTTLTQFLSNTTVIAMILPIIFPIAQEMGYNFFSFAVGLTMATSMAVATPLANTTIGMAMVANYRFSDYLKYGGPMTLLALTILMILTPVLWPLI